MKISVNNGSTVPQSFITKGKQRLKQYLDTVYLNDGDEFEIELFNPTTNKILAKIELNGDSIGNGIVIRPGERVFLERYLNETKKFMFKTYFVHGYDEEVINAIVKNGDIVVNFFNEKKFETFNSLPTYTYHNPNLSWSVTGGSSSNWGVSKTTGTGTYTTNTSLYNYITPTSTIETGRVEKNGQSNQTLISDNSIFETYPSFNNWWKIKPMNEKSITKEDLTVYCTECGAKRKKDTFKFCPHCGTKF